MDFIVSYQLYKKMRKNKINELNDILKDKESEEKSQESNEHTKEDKIIFKSCERCGQDPYFCQCEENTKLRYLNFNPEKDNY